MSDALFENFWLAGMRKCKKKQTKPLFNKLLKKSGDGESFTNMLINDIRKRLASNQLGFAEMHPTTYLNGERWNDEVIQTPKPQQQTPIDSIELLTDRTWADDLMTGGNTIEQQEFYK